MRQREDTNTLLVKWLLATGVATNQINGDESFKIFANALIALGGSKRNYSVPTANTIRQVSRKLSGEHEELIRSWLHRGCKTASLSVDGVLSLFFTYLRCQVGVLRVGCLIGQLYFILWTL